MVFVENMKYWEDQWMHFVGYLNSGSRGPCEISSKSEWERMANHVGRCLLMHSLSRLVVRNTGRNILESKLFLSSFPKNVLRNGRWECIWVCVNCMLCVKNCADRLTLKFVFTSGGSWLLICSHYSGFFLAKPRIRSTCRQCLF